MLKNSNFLEMQPCISATRNGIQCLNAKQDMMICLMFYSFFDWVKSFRTLIETEVQEAKTVSD